MNLGRSFARLRAALSGASDTEAMDLPNTVVGVLSLVDALGQEFLPPQEANIADPAVQVVQEITLDGLYDIYAFGSLSTLGAADRRFGLAIRDESNTQLARWERQIGAIDTVALPTAPVRAWLRAGWDVVLAVDIGTAGDNGRLSLQVIRRLAP